MLAIQTAPYRRRRCLNVTTVPNPTACAMVNGCIPRRRWRDTDRRFKSERRTRQSVAEQQRQRERYECARCSVHFVIFRFFRSPCTVGTNSTEYGFMPSSLRDEYDSMLSSSASAGDVSLVKEESGSPSNIRSSARLKGGSWHSSTSPIAAGVVLPIAAGANRRASVIGAKPTLGSSRTNGTTTDTSSSSPSQSPTYVAAANEIDPFVCC